MQYRRVGASGLLVSSLSLGGWLTLGCRLSQRESQAVVRTALDEGINFIDLADVYAKGSAERTVGKILRGRRRHQVVISSKCFGPMSEGPNDRGLSRKHILESCDASLKRLGMDYLDLYFCHRDDPEVPLEETVRAMDHLVRQGKILYWGTSCWSAPRLREAVELCRAGGYYGPTVEQPQYSLLERSIEADVLPTCLDLGLGLAVWSPLAGGALTGKYAAGVGKGTRAATTKWVEQYLKEGGQEKLAAFSDLARGVAQKPGQLALAFLLANQAISTVITGATSKEQVRENLAALDAKLDRTLAARLDELFPPPPRTA